MARTSARACSVQTIPLPIPVRGFFHQRFLSHLVPVGRGQAELCQHFLMRDRLVVLEPFIGLGDGLALSMAQGVSILVVDHDFEQLGDSVELRGVELIEQLVGLLSIHDLPLCAASLVTFYMITGHSLAVGGRAKDRDDNNPYAGGNAAAATAISAALTFPQPGELPLSPY